MASHIDNSDFGIIVTCSEFDFNLAKGTCASIRHFIPDIPICLLIDGSFELGRLPELLNVSILTRNEVKDPFLKKNSFGWGITKMIAFWESPFKRFLMIDADTVVFGDVTKLKDFERFDFILDKPGYYEHTAESLNNYFFDTKKIHKYYPLFDYAEKPFACTGVIFGTRGLLEIDEYKRFFEIRKLDPDFFKCGEQGFLNILLLKSAEETLIRLGHKQTQYIVPDHSRQVSEERFSNDFSNVTNPIVIHWAGETKPYIFNADKIFHRPMTYFRKQYILKHGILEPDKQESLLISEEASLVRAVAARRRRELFRKLTREAIRKLFMTVFGRKLYAQVRNRLRELS